MNTPNQTLYKTPFSPAYWRDALEEFRTLRTLTFAALMVAVCFALAQVPAIPLTDGLRVTWGFLGRTVCAWVGGPITALVFGFVEDNLSFIMHPTGAYFPGYTLTTMLGTFVYALFFYRAKMSVMRIFLAKLATNALNVVLGSLWSAILYSKGYLYYMTTSLVKNVLMLPVQTIMLVVLFTALLPILHRTGFLKGQLQHKISLR